MAFRTEMDTGTPIRVADEQVTLTIDGREVSVPKGTSVMAAAALMQAPIPKLCATDSLEAFGSCRLCLVEIEGRKGTPASCTTPAENGMVVHTQTRQARQAAARRDGALHLRSPARLPDLLGQRRLRIADAGRRRRPARRALRLQGRQPLRRAEGRDRIPISPSKPPSASSARAACAPARKCRARSR